MLPVLPTILIFENNKNKDNNNNYYCNKTVSISLVTCKWKLNYQVVFLIYQFNAAKSNQSKSKSHLSAELGPDQPQLVSLLMLKTKCLLMFIVPPQIIKFET